MTRTAERQQPDEFRDPYYYGMLVVGGLNLAALVWSLTPWFPWA